MCLSGTTQYIESSVYTTITIDEDRTASRDAHVVGHAMHVSRRGFRGMPQYELVDGER